MEDTGIQSGNDLLKAIRGMREFLGDVSKLLQTAESLLAERQWQAGDSFAIFDMSYAVDAGRLWMPRECARFYTSSAAPNIVLAVAVLLDGYDRNYSLTEPVVSGTMFRLPGKTSTKAIAKWQVQWFGWTEAAMDGTVCSMKGTNNGWKPAWVWQEMKVFGRPLVMIRDEMALKTLVVDPLLQLVED